MSEPIQPPIQKPCPECGGKRVKVVLQTTQGDSLQAKQPARKVKFFSDLLNNTSLYGLSCTTCGYTAHFASEPGNLTPDPQ